MHPHDPRALHDANDGSGERAVESIIQFPIQRLADEVFVGNRDQGWQPDRDDLLQASGELERMEGVLVEVVPRINDEPFERYTGCHCAVDAIAQERDDLCSDIIINADMAARCAAVRGCGQARV